MTDPLPSPGRSDPPAYPGAPRWVKVLGTVVAALVLLFVILKLLGFEHGPGRHMQHGSSTGSAAPLNSQDATAPASGGG